MSPTAVAASLPLSRGPPHCEISYFVLLPLGLIDFRTLLAFLDLGHRPYLALPAYWIVTPGLALSADSRNHYCLTEEAIDDVVLAAHAVIHHLASAARRDQQCGRVTGTRAVGHLDEHVGSIVEGP